MSRGMWHELSITTQEGEERPSLTRFIATLQDSTSYKLDSLGLHNLAHPDERQDPVTKATTIVSQWDESYETGGVRHAARRLSSRFPHAVVHVELEWDGDGGPSIEREDYVDGVVVRDLPQVMLPVSPREWVIIEGGVVTSHSDGVQVFDLDELKLGPNIEADQLALSEAERVGATYAADAYRASIATAKENQ